MADKTKLQKLQAVLDEIRRQYHDLIAAEIQHSNKSYALIGSEYGVSEQTVYTIDRERGISRNSQLRKVNSGQSNSDSTSTEGGSEHGL